MIWVLAGTRDGRHIARRLEQEGWPVLSSSVSEYGQLLLRESVQGETLSGPLNEASMTETIRQYGIHLVIDATHPYAVIATQNIERACRQENIPRVRFERESLYQEGSESFQNITWVDDAPAAARKAKKYPGGVFLATGSRTLEVFARELGPEKLIVRVLPTPESLQACQSAGICPKRIVALQGPFSAALNRELFYQHGARVLVTKESGKTGGFLEKLEAARQLGIPVIAIKRPECRAEEVFSRVDELVDFVTDMMPEAENDPQAALKD